MDTNQFTSELVQFSSVEQQINTNTSLTQLIQLTQAGEVMQASAMTGKQVTVTSDHVPLQNGTRNDPVHHADGRAGRYPDLRCKRQQAERQHDDVDGRQQQWTWNGTDSSGDDGAGRQLQGRGGGGNADGTTSALHTNVVGTATGVQSQSTGMQLELGALSVDFSQVQSVGN